MRKVILSISAFVLLLSACKKDDAAPEGEWQLSKFTSIEVERKDTTVTLVGYNADKTVKELIESGTEDGVPWNYSLQSVYEGNKLVSFRESDNEDPAPRTTDAIVYNGDKVARIDYYGFNGDDQWVITGTYEMTYNAQGKVSAITRKSVPASEYESIYKLTWDGENVKSMTVFNVVGTDTSQANTVNFYYDDKPGIHKVLFGMYNWLSSPTLVEYLSANNLVKEEVFYNEELYTRNTYERSYNERNQITEVREKRASLKDPVSESNTIVKFEYTKK